MTILAIITTYFIFVFVLLRLTIPHLGFKKETLPEVLPSDFSKIITDISARSKDSLDLLKNVYEYVTAQYPGSRLRTITNFWVAYEEPVNHKPGFLPCTSQNYLIRLMLVKSGRFQEQDIKIVATPFNLFIHQYLKVKVGDIWMDVDPWSHFIGVPLGKKSSIVG